MPSREKPSNQELPKSRLNGNRTIFKGLLVSALAGGASGAVAVVISAEAANRAPAWAAALGVSVYLVYEAFAMALTYLSLGLALLIGWAVLRVFRVRYSRQIVIYGLGLTLPLTVIWWLIILAISLIAGGGVVVFSAQSVISSGWQISYVAAGALSFMVVWAAVERQWSRRLIVVLSVIGYCLYLVPMVLGHWRF